MDARYMSPPLVLSHLTHGRGLFNHASRRPFRKGKGVSSDLSAKGQTMAVETVLAASRGKSGGCMCYWGMEIIDDSTTCGGGLIGVS